MNNSSEPAIEAIFGDPWAITEHPYWRYFYFFIAPYMVIALTALVGNAVTITTIIYVKKLHSATYILLCSLSISDLFFTLLGPFLVHFLFLPGNWFLGSVGCKLVFFFLRFQYSYSVLLLVTAAGFRFLAIRFPLLYRRRRPQSKMTIVIILAISFAVCAPYLHALDAQSNGPYVDCYLYNWTRKQRELYHYIMQILLYVLPLITMIFLYTATCIKLRQKLPGQRSQNQLMIESRRRRMAYLLMVLVGCFFICWTPFGCVEVYSLLHPQSNIMVPYFIAMLLVFASAAINPIIYCYLSNEFRHGLKTLMHAISKKTGCHSRYPRKYRLKSITSGGFFVEEVITSL